MANDPTFPGVTSGFGSRIALDLGQEDVSYPWRLPESRDSGTTRSESPVRSGTEFDPPIVILRLYEDMRFYDRILGEWLTVEEFAYHRHAYAEDMGPTWYVEFRESPPEDAPPTDSRYGLNESRFRELLLRENIVLRSGVEHYADAGEEWAQTALDHE